MTNQVSHDIVTTVSYIPAIIFQNNNLITDDQKVAYMYASHCNSNNVITNTEASILSYLNLMRIEITNINPQVVWDVNVPMNPTAAELNAYNNSVHGKNYRDIYNYVLSRIQGSANFNPNYRVEYLWVAPVVRGAQVMLNRFLSAGDIATIQQVTR